MIPCRLRDLASKAVHPMKADHQNQKLALVENCSLARNVHLANRSSDFGPDAVNLLVEPLKRESLKGRVGLRQEAHQTRGGCKGGHFGGDVLPRSGSCKYWVAWAARWVAMGCVAAGKQAVAAAGRRKGCGRVCRWIRRLVLGE